MSRKILMIGNASSVWIMGLVKNIHNELKHSVTVLSFNNIPQDMYEEYEKIGITVKQVYSKNIMSKIKDTLKILFYIFKNRNEFDFCEIHYPPSSIQVYFLRLIEKIISTTNIVVFWGSDILRISEFKARRLEIIIKCSDIVNLSTSEMKAKFESFFGQKYRKKYVAARFGSLAFDAQRKVKSQFSKEQCKSILGIDKKKKTIAIGYNGRRAQQHLSVIDSISQLNNNIKKNLCLILHIISLENEAYYKELQCALENCGIEYLIIDKKLSLDEIAILRQATDIFIHAQITDAFSATVREVIYSNAILINPNWIHYDEFDAHGVEYLQYSEFCEITQIVENVLNGKISIDIERNAEIVYSHYSWDAVLKDWQRIYNGQIN